MSAAAESVADPAALAEAFRDAATALHGLVEACVGRVSDDEVCCEASGRLQQPVAFLQTLSDLLRVVFEPHPPGSMLLNSNWDLLVMGIPDRPFRLVHFTETSEPGESVQRLFHERVTGQLAVLGCDPWHCLGAYVAVCLPPGEPVLPALGAALRLFGAGFSVDTARLAIEGLAAGEPPLALPSAHAGIARDATLRPGQARVSGWLFLPEPAERH